MPLSLLLKGIFFEKDLAVSHFPQSPFPLVRASR